MGDCDRGVSRRIGNFFVGDLVILIGTVFIMVILALIDSVGALAALQRAKSQQKICLATN